MIATTSLCNPDAVATQNLLGFLKCKSRGGSSRPPVKRKIAPRSSTSHATHAKTSSLMDDAPFLTVSDDDDGLSVGILDLMRQSK
ncbi:hypothetical protein Tco_0984666 [Tanacetum coccineum]